MGDRVTYLKKLQKLMGFSKNEWVFLGIKKSVILKTKFIYVKTQFNHKYDKI